MGRLSVVALMDLPPVTVVKTGERKPNSPAVEDSWFSLAGSVFDVPARDETRLLCTGFIIGDRPLDPLGSRIVCGCVSSCFVKRLRASANFFIG